MAKPVTGIVPAVLRWARESQGYSIEDVAEKLKRDSSEVEAWEAGEGAPTYVQLEKLAYTIYKRPLAVFFLPKPPQEIDLKKEFRTLPEADIEMLAADTRYQLRLAQAFQESLRELNDGRNPAERQIFKDMRLELGKPIAPQAKRVREYLGISLADQQAWKDQRSAVQNWRNAIEHAGVFVFKNSFKQKDISGFCLPDTELPIIYLNNSTTHTRQVFSLHHELAHVLLDISAISKGDPEYIERLPRQAQRIERFCNAFAAELLIPEQDFAARLAGISEFTEEEIEELARRYWVSREAVLRKLLDRGLVSQNYYEKKAKEWAKQKKDGTGGNYYATRATYLGEGFMNLVLSKYYQGKLGVEQVADYFGVKTGSVAGLEQIVLGKESA
jgi:Zn-dependent peptidase ImmA (M78 family)/transcriptional regulator with XRE-family HTH domain